MPAELRWTLRAGLAAVLTFGAGFGWFEHRSQQLEFGRVRARLEVQTQELAATRGELERMSRLIALELASLRGTEARVLPSNSATAAATLARGAELPTQPTDLAVVATPPSPVELESLQTASAMLQAALAAGRWTGADSARFREQLSRLSEDDKATLMTELTTAINRDKLRLDGAPAPF
jgi:hypothetical protein